MKVLGLDVETQGVDRLTTRITEVGAILYEVNRVNYEVNRVNPLEPITLITQFHQLKVLNELCYEADYPPQEPDIVALTGITDEKLKKEGKPRVEVFKELLPLVLEADLIIAHRADFDRNVLKANFDAVGLEFPKKKWFCTLTDINWDKKYTCKKLSHLAYEHGILVDPRTLHRATNDINLMMRLVSLYDFKGLLDYYEKPWIYLKAEVLGPWQDGGTQNGIAKSLGFSYEQVPGVDQYKWPKKWVKRLKYESDWELILEKVRKSPSPFRISQIEGV